MNGDILKVGDRVLWSHSWGTDPYKEATIESITLCEQENSKDAIMFFKNKEPSSKRMYQINVFIRFFTTTCK